MTRRRAAHRADTPPAVDPTILGDVVATALAVAAVVYALTLAVLLPAGTSAFVFVLTAAGGWAAWPFIAPAALLGGAR